MRKILIALALVVLVVAPAAATDETDVMAAITGFVVAFNRGDADAAVALCMDDMSIIDEFSPFEWHGPGTLLKWFKDYDADAKRNGITDGIVTLGKTKHLFVDAGRAYAVIPSAYDYKQNGKPVNQTDSAFTFALKKTESGWRITGWSWAQN